MKIKKIFLILFLSFFGVISVNAVSEAVATSNYEKYDTAYRIIAALNYYYDNSVIINADSSTVSTRLEEVWEKAHDTFLQGTGVTKDNLKSIYLIYETSGISAVALPESIINFSQIASEGNCNNISYSGDPTLETEARSVCETYKAQITKFTSLAEVLQYATNHLRNMARDSRQETFSSRFRETTSITENLYSSFCDFLNHSPSTAYYLNMILRLVSYAALALAVILGALDFTKAITSNDDAALKKAFQSFVKRIVAVALIFLTYVIVQIIIGLTPRLPNVKAQDIELCEQLKIGGLKGFENG